MNCKLRKIELQREKEPRVLQTVLLRRLGISCVFFAHHLVKDKNILCKGESMEAQIAVATFSPHTCLEMHAFNHVAFRWASSQ